MSRRLEGEQMDSTMERRVFGDQRRPTAKHPAQPAVPRGEAVSPTPEQSNLQERLDLLERRMLAIEMEVQGMRPQRLEGKRDE
jgi:hypothetical protein